jgi:VWFA-related protein
MRLRIPSRAFLFSLIPLCALAQQHSPQYGSNGQPLNPEFPMLVEQQRLDAWFLHTMGNERTARPEKLPDGISKLDLMAPGKARGEYDKGFVESYRQNFNRAVVHFEKAVSIFPRYFAAHNALGTVYMRLGMNEKARSEFQTAASLDDHLPHSYSNLALACLTLKDYPAAVQAAQKASSISPLDLKLPVLLAYSELMNQDYPAALATAQQLHGRKHGHSAVVHYLAAVAQQSQQNPDGMRTELQLFLQEDPEGPNAEQAREFIAKIDAWRSGTPNSAISVSYGPDSSETVASPGSSPTLTRNALAQFRLQTQLESAECETCSEASSEPGSNLPIKSTMATSSRPRNDSPWTLHSAVDEVGVFFAVTDGGRAVADLNLADLKLMDDRKAPAAVLDFRNESNLPLRLGFVIDTSASVTDRFAFEQKAATEFLQQVLTDKNDQAFVTGFANTVLMVQDFTNNKDDVAASIRKLAPTGGTALWDAVTFAAEKIGSLRETTPLARILVVLSDGEDNSSSTSLKQAIETAQREEVIVYAVSTKDDSRDTRLTLGDRALKALAQQTGGTAFFPGSLGHLNRSLNSLREVVRSRYLISYKPAQFASDGRYRSIELAAYKSGRKLRVYARKGYFALPAGSTPN